MAKDEKLAKAMAEMEQFEREYHDSSHELPEPNEPDGGEPQPKEGAEGADGGEAGEAAAAADHQPQPGQEPTEPTAGGAELPGTEPKGPQRYSIPNDPKKYGDLAGKEVTEEEFLRSGLVTKMLGQEHQELHHMKKYQEEVPALRSEVEELRKRLEQSAPAAKPPADQPVPITPERVEQFGQELERAFLPQIQKFAEMGGIEEHLVTDSPRFLSTLEFRFQSGQKVLDTLVKGFGALAADWLERNQAQTSSEARSILEDSMIGIAAQDGFGQLSDSTHREEFGQWLAEHKSYVEMDVRDLKGDDLEIAYLKFMKTKGVSPQEAAKGHQTSRKREAALATGGSGGGAGRGGGTAPQGEIEKFLEEFQKAQDARW